MFFFVTEVKLLTNKVIRRGVSVVDGELLGSLAAKAQDGDQASYKEFLLLVSQKYKPRFLRFLSPQAADDALQEMLLAIHKALHTYDRNKALAPWLNAIAHYKLQDQMRSIYKNARHVELKEDLASLDSGFTNAPDVHKVLKKLPDRESQLLYFLKIEELSVAEVSKKMGISESNVKVSCFRALRKLKEILAEEEFHERS